MESHFFHLLNTFPIPIHRNSSRSFTTLVTAYGPFFAGCSRRHWHRSAIPDKRSRFRDVFATDEYDGSEFRRNNKRIWWSDDSYEDDDDDDEDEGFGFVDGSIALNWISKAFQSFGWMIPAVVVSLVMGNGPDTIVMTLALPLAQSLFSFAADTFWGKPDGTSRQKRRSKKRPVSRTSYSRVGKEYRKPSRTGNESGGYKSWIAVDNVSEKNEKSSKKFGGWDELDNIQVKVDREPGEIKREPRETFTKNKQQN